VFLSEDRISRSRGLNAFANQDLGRVVGFGHVTGVGFAVDAQVVRSEARHRERVGGVGKFEGEDKIGVDERTLSERDRANDETRRRSCAMLERWFVLAHFSP
jgi:hypothetical protein